MKKILLSAVALVATMTVNAQEYCAFNVDDNADFAATAITSDGVTLTAGTVIGKTTSITATIGGEDSYKSSSLGSMTIGETSINGGIQGSTNPKDADGNTCSQTLLAPVSGAYYDFTANADGYLYVLQKASSNKAYTVFENGLPIGYTFAAIGDASTALGQVYGYTLVGTLEVEGIGGYLQASDLAGGQVQWAEKIALGYKDGDEWTDIKKGGLGVIKFPVFEGCKYSVNANGSKMSASGFFFDTTGDATITAKVDDADIVILEAGQVPGTTGINSVKSSNNNSSAIYNIAGQKVAKDYKGLVIVNGKKMIQK